MCLKCVVHKCVGNKTSFRKIVLKISKTVYEKTTMGGLMTKIKTQKLILKIIN